MNTIPLRNSKKEIIAYAIVDDEDFEELNQFKWYCKDGYAKRNGVRENHKRYLIHMHRIINNTPEGLETDHINRNRLDNRKCNLRTAIGSQNQMNTGLRRDNVSGIKGVHWHKASQKWEVEIRVNTENKYLGLYSTLQGAWLARRWGERMYWSKRQGQSV